MNMKVILDQVLPEGSILYKHNHGAFDFYKNDSDLLKGESFMSQDPSENFESFLAKLINKLMVEEKERGDDEPLVTIDFAIWGQK